MFDKDNSGGIEMAELKKVFKQGNVSEEVWE